MPRALTSPAPHHGRAHTRPTEDDIRRLRKLVSDVGKMRAVRDLGMGYLTLDNILGGGSVDGATLDRLRAGLTRWAP